jgi:hypothetical protein
MRKHPSLVSYFAGLAALVAASMPAFSQGLNIDLFSNSPSTVPSPAFAAASGQSGVWNGITCTFCEPQVFPLVDLAGQPSGATLEMILGGGLLPCTNPALTPDEQAFLSSGQLGSDVFSAINGRVAGLTSGFYDVYVYASKRCDQTATTYVTTQIALQVGSGNVFALQEQNSEGDVLPGQVFGERGNYVRFRINIASGQTLYFHILAFSPGWFSAHGIQIVPVAASTIPVCFGTSDTSGCPCGAAPWGRGCGWSINGAGAALIGTGTTSIASDNLVLSADGLSNSVATFFQGTSLIGQGVGAVFGDGLRCAGGSMVRIAARQASGGLASYPAAGDVPISVRGHVPAGGGTRLYQALYRDPAAFCTPATFNATNGVYVVWAP